MRRKPLFDISFVIHYKSGQSIHGIWNTGEGYDFLGQKKTFSELCEVDVVTSIESVYREKSTGKLNRFTLSVSNVNKKIRWVMLYSGLIGDGFGQFQLQPLNSESEQRIVAVPGAIKMTMLALEVIDDIPRTPLGAYKNYPVLAKSTIDVYGDFECT